MNGQARLGFWQLFAASIGVIVAQIGMVSLTQGIGLGGWGFVGALAIAFAIAMANAMAYAEMALMMPSAGSLSRYAEVALGDFPAILVVFAGYVTPALFGLPAELLLAEQILREVVPVAVPPYFWAVSIVVVFTALNILGTDVFARVQTTLSFIVLVFLLVTGITAFAGHATGGVGSVGGHAWAALGEGTQTLGLVALAFWVFVGSEFVTPLITEAENPKRDLPRAMLGGLAVLFGAQVLFAIGSGLVLPRSALAESATPHFDYAVATFGSSARIWFAVLAIVASASLINTVVAAVPRMLWGMAKNGQVFPILGYTHRRFKTPVVAILFVAALPIVGLFWAHGDVAAILPLMIAASVSWLLAYMLAQVSLMILRQRYPTVDRPFRVPGYPFTPLIALAGMAFVALNSSPEPAMTPRIVAYTGIVLIVFAAVGAFWVRVVMRRGLFEAAPLEERAGHP